MQPLGAELLDKLTQIGRVEVYEAGSIIFFEGERAKNFYVLLDGKVRLYKSDEKTSKEYTIHTLIAPTFIAEMPFFMQQNYPASAQTCEKSEILCIGYKTFETYILQDSHICLLLISSLCHKIRILESYIASSAQSLEDRLLDYLASHKENLANLTQRSIAQAINTTPESLSRLLKSLKQQGILQTNKGKISLYT